MTIGFVTDTNNPGITNSDNLLKIAFENEGLNVVEYQWDSKNSKLHVDYLLIRSCWNYYESIEEFLLFIQECSEDGIHIVNDPKLLYWNCNKKYMIELANKGINVIQTIMIEKKNIHKVNSIAKENNWTEFVTKPIFGASAHEVGIHRHPLSRDQISNLSESNCDILLQPLMKEVADGEVSLMFFREKFSHAVIKIPQDGTYISNPSKGGKERIFIPSQDIVHQAKSIVDVLPIIPSYARVDGLVINNKFILMELELIEPHLFFDFDLQSAERFVGVFQKNIKKSMKLN